MVKTTAGVPRNSRFGGLPDHVLRQELRSEHEMDRTRTARRVALLAEVECRRLHRPAGYASLLRYCVGALGMSEDVAWKRIQAARAARRHPSIFAMLADNRRTLTSVVLLDPHLTRENAAELLAAAERRSMREVQELIAARFPQPDLSSPLAPISDPRIATPVATQL